MSKLAKSRLGCAPFLDASTKFSLSRLLGYRHAFRSLILIKSLDIRVVLDSIVRAVLLHYFLGNGVPRVVSQTVVESYLKSS